MKPKTIFCRIGDDEFSRLAELSARNGASVSEVLRNALREVLSRESENPDPVMRSVQNLSEQMKRVLDDLEVVKAELGGLAAIVTTGGKGRVRAKGTIAQGN